MEIFDSAVKASWARKNAMQIAVTYGYYLDNNFLTALDVMINRAKTAEVTTLLGSIAQGTFAAWVPHLERIHINPISTVTPTSSPISPQIPVKGNIFNRLKHRITRG